MDRGRAVHDKSSDPTPAHQVGQNVCQTAFDDVSAKSPQDGALFGSGTFESADDRAEPVGCQQVRHRIEQRADAQAFFVRFREMFYAHFSAACFERDGLQRVK